MAMAAMAWEDKHPELLAEAQRLRAEGWTQQQIAKRFGVSQPTISKALNPAVREAQNARGRVENMTPEQREARRARMPYYLHRYRRSPLGRAMTLATAATNRAKKKGLPCADKEALVEFVHMGMEKGMPHNGLPYNLDEPEQKGRNRPDAPSIDQIIPGKGYTLDNVRVIPFCMNIALHDFTPDDRRKILPGMFRYLADLLESEDK